MRLHAYHIMRVVHLLFMFSNFAGDYMIFQRSRALRHVSSKLREFGKLRSRRS